MGFEVPAQRLRKEGIEIRRPPFFNERAGCCQEFLGELGLDGRLQAGILARTGDV